jgi:hypothetical protein
MNSYMVGSFVGSLFICFFISRLFNRLLRKWDFGHRKLSFIVAGATALTSLLISWAGRGDLDNWAYYVLGSLVILCFDLSRRGPSKNQWESRCHSLGVPSDPSKAEIEKAYKAFTGILPTDLQNVSELAKKKFQEIRHSYDYLRKNYSRRPRSRAARELGSSTNVHPLKAKKWPHQTPQRLSFSIALTRTNFIKVVSVQIAVLFGLGIYLQFETLKDFALSRSPNETRITSNGTPISSHPTHTSVRTRPTGDCLLEVTTDPPGATIYVNDREVGISTTTVPGACNSSVKVTIKLEGFETVSRNADYRSSIARLYETLKRQPLGQLEIIASQDAQVYVDGRLWGDARANQTIQISVRANVPHKIRFVNQVYGIDTNREYTVEVDSVITDSIRLEGK